MIEDKNIEQFIREIIKGFFSKEHEIKLNDNLKQYGFDEVDFTDIIIKSEEKYDIMINDLEFDECKTLHDMVVFIKNLLIQKNIK